MWPGRRRIGNLDYWLLSAWFCAGFMCPLLSTYCLANCLYDQWSFMTQRLEATSYLSGKASRIMLSLHFLSIVLDNTPQWQIQGVSAVFGHRPRLQGWSYTSMDIWQDSRSRLGTSLRPTTLHLPWIWLQSVSKTPAYRVNSGILWLLRQSCSRSWQSWGCDDYLATHVSTILLKFLDPP